MLSRRSSVQRAPLSVVASRLFLAPAEARKNNKQIPPRNRVHTSKCTSKCRTTNTHPGTRVAFAGNNTPSKPTVLAVAIDRMAHKIGKKKLGCGATIVALFLQSRELGV